MIFLYIFLIGIALLTVLIVLFRMRHARSIRKKGIFTNGTIRSITPRIYGRGTRLEEVQFEYEDRTTGRSFNGRTLTTPGKFQMGKPVEVIYLPDDPSKYTLDGGKYYWPLLVSAIILLVFIIFAVYKLDHIGK